eukprot:1686813-Amphidinium_carterae.2
MQTVTSVGTETALCLMCKVNALGINAKSTGAIGDHELHMYVRPHEIPVFCKLRMSKPFGMERNS